jgi:hypothetical protein
MATTSLEVGTGKSRATSPSEVIRSDPGTASSASRSEVGIVLLRQPAYSNGGLHNSEVSGRG